MKALLALILSATLLAPVNAAPVDADKLYKEQLERYRAWSYACEISKYSCIGVKVPEVVNKSLRPGLQGRYTGDGTVIISKRLRGEAKMEVLIHEMVHYLQHQNGLPVPGPAKLICEAEAEAWAAGDTYWRMIDKPWMQAGDRWWRPYTHCHQFYDPDYDPKYDWWKSITVWG